MQLILTSFGLSHLGEPLAAGQSPFYRMPPVGLSQLKQSFAPDYAVLLLCDRLIVDGESFERLSSRRHSFYREMSETMDALKSEGFIQVEDFDTVIKTKATLLQSVLNKDLADLEAWVMPERSWRRVARVRSFVRRPSIA